MGLVRLDDLARATADEAQAFVAASDPRVLVDEVRSMSDDALVALIDREEIRAVLMAGVLGRLGEIAVPDGVAGRYGAAALEFEHRGRVVARHAITVTDGDLAFVADPDALPALDVTLRTSILLFIRLACGQANAGLEYLAGRLGIDGDAELALALGGMFPDATGTPVDPRALDPVEVATVLKHVDGGHLRTVMASGFRPVVLDEIFRRIPDFLDQRKAAGLRLTIGFRLTGRADGETDRFVIAVADGRATVAGGAAAEAIGADARHATVTCDACDFLKLVTGHLGAVTGVLRGQLKVRGDKAAALRLNAAFDIPTAVA